MGSMEPMEPPLDLPLPQWVRHGQGNLPPSKCQVPITAGWTGMGMMLGGKTSHFWMEHDD